jgi:hypothetical protein
MTARRSDQTLYKVCDNVQTRDPHQLPVSIAENFNTVFNGLGIMPIQSGTMRPTSTIARTESISYLDHPICPGPPKRLGIWAQEEMRSSMVVRDQLTSALGCTGLFHGCTPPRVSLQTLSDSVCSKRAICQVSALRSHHYNIPSN